MVKLFLIGFLGAGLALMSQVPRAAVRINAPSTAERGINQDHPGTQIASQVGEPILGFVGGPGPLELRAILGVFGAARLSQPVKVPETVTRLYLSARQHYALVEQNSGAPLKVWRLDETVLPGHKAADDGFAAIAGALPHPDLVAFSPRGESVALYISASRQLQVIGGMPNKPFIKKTPPLESPGTITMIALSDDASVVVTKDSAEDLQISNGDASWRPFYGAYSPLAWSFTPKTHDLIISDSQENAVFLIEQADSKYTRAVLADTCLPDQLAITSNGETLAALDSRRSILWTINLKNRDSNITTLAQNPDSLTILRNGNTFLVSSRNTSPALLKIADSAAVQTAAIHEATVLGSR